MYCVWVQPCPHIRCPHFNMREKSQGIVMKDMQEALGSVKILETIVLRYIYIYIYIFFLGGRP